MNYNNCSGKHLAMLTSCMANKYKIEKYLDFNHPHQREIREVFNKFTESKLTKKNFSLDGCSAPQYSFQIKSISKALNNLIKSYNNEFVYTMPIRLLINSILKNPSYIGGTTSFDSQIIDASKSKIFCKHGAEGVFLFVHFKKGVSGVVKVTDAMKEPYR